MLFYLAPDAAEAGRVRFMQDIQSAVLLAFRLIVNLDPGLMEIVLLSLRVSLLSMLVSCMIGLPLGAALAVIRFPGRRAVIILLNAMMGLPPVVVGLLVYLHLSRSGPLGWLGLLYTPTAMVLAQTILITPIVIALARQILEDLHGEYAELFLSLQLSRFRRMAAILRDGRFSLLTVAMAAFGRSIAEVGAVIIVGGNIEHLTRVMTTAIALETSRGNLALALALGLVLLVTALTVNGVGATLYLAGGRHGRS